MNQIELTIEQRKDYLKSELMKYGYFKTPDGKQLYELSLAELEKIHITVKCQYGKAMDD